MTEFLIVFPDFEDWYEQNCKLCNKGNIKNGKLICEIENELNESYFGNKKLKIEIIERIGFFDNDWETKSKCKEKNK